MLSDHAFYCSVGARPTLALGFTSRLGNHKVGPEAVKKAFSHFVAPQRSVRAGHVPGQFDWISATAYPT
jgi:hypothetical protein